MPFLHRIRVVEHQPLGERRDGAAFTGDLGRDALGHLRQDAIIDERVDLRLAHHVDEAGSDDEAAHVERLTRRGGAEESHGHDPIAPNGDVSVMTGIAAAVDDPTALQDQVVRAVTTCRRAHPAAGHEYEGKQTADG